MVKKTSFRWHDGSGAQTKPTTIVVHRRNVTRGSANMARSFGIGSPFSANQQNGRDGGHTDIVTSHVVWSMNVSV